MNPQEKAKVLVQLFTEQHDDWPSVQGVDLLGFAKRCAKVFVEQHIIECSPSVNRIYWNKVKQKIDEI